MKKARDAFRTISEAAEELDLPQHVLRHWEDSFGAIRPMRRAGGRRYYRLQDIELLSGVKVLLHEQGFTTKGVQKIFSDRGAGHVAALGQENLVGHQTKKVSPVQIERDQLQSLLDQSRALKATVEKLRISLLS